MPQPEPAQTQLAQGPVTPPWPLRLAAWPGLLTLLSVLAVLLGHPPQVTDQGPRVTAGSVAPALPEWRAAPQPTPGPALGAAPPPEPFRVPGQVAGIQGSLPCWTVPAEPRSLAWLGRRQTDGG